MWLVEVKINMFLFILKKDLINGTAFVDITRLAIVAFYSPFFITFTPFQFPFALKSLL